MLLVELLLLLMLRRDVPFGAMGWLVDPRIPKEEEEKKKEMESIRQLLRAGNPTKTMERIRWENLGKTLVRWGIVDSGARKTKKGKSPQVQKQEKLRDIQSQIAAIEEQPAKQSEMQRTWNR